MILIKTQHEKSLRHTPDRFCEELAGTLLPKSIPSRSVACVGSFAPITVDYCVTNVIGCLTAGLVRKLQWLVAVFKQNWFLPPRWCQGTFGYYGERCTTLPTMPLESLLRVVPVMQRRFRLSSLSCLNRSGRKAATLVLIPRCLLLSQSEDGITAVHSGVQPIPSKLLLYFRSHECYN